ncbi:MAG: hypothetical protein M9899_04205 [Bdellovibrionaceae bacterium]|nr:hypothetical protein [Pseudobdellovibrionaceae bacterium]
MGQFRKSVKRLENDKRIVDILVKANEKNAAEIQKDLADLPDLSAKAKKVPMSDIAQRKE